MKNLLVGALLLIQIFSSSAQGKSRCNCNCDCSYKKDPSLPTDCNNANVGYHGGRYRPIDCEDLKRRGEANTTGVYTIFPKNARFRVRCDMDTDGGGWTVIQRRTCASDFYKNWDDYQTGFGDLLTNFWLGLQQIHLLTSQSWYELRIDMTGPDGEERYAQYGLFEIANAFDKYRLLVGNYSGNAGDNLSPHNGGRFSTKDSDNDANSRASCAKSYVGAWWYMNCHTSNLNGLYGSTAYGKGLNWYTYTTLSKSLTKVEMKIRRRYSGEILTSIPAQAYP